MELCSQNTDYLQSQIDSSTSRELSDTCNIGLWIDLVQCLILMQEKAKHLCKNNEIVV